MKIEDVLKKLNVLYGENIDELDYQRKRYIDLYEKYQQEFKSENFYFFSVPGRTEISGNHTDHNNGKVLAGSVNLDSIAIASPNDSPIVKIYSIGYNEPFQISLSELNSFENEKGTTNSLIRGIASRFNQLNCNINGFDALISSDVLPGSGLSSSASIEVLIGIIFNVLFNNGVIKHERLAKIGQFAENNFFGKPCGLMDQMTCAMGNVVAIDFKDFQNPIVEKINLDLDSLNYKLVVVDTGKNHTDLTDDYASIPKEMFSVAKYFGVKNCREISYSQLLDNIENLRKEVGDRAILRTIHFLEENERVEKQVTALKENRFNDFLELVNESGSSSIKWLQNIYSTKNTNEQGTTLALAITNNFISKIGEGACRIHGGGFAGTILCFLPKNHIQEYKKIITPVFGQNSIKVLSIRKQGIYCFDEEICNGNSF
ncbi:MAG: galactokinase [Ignavibacteriae bacterium]|nr:MAG: galactokinase [Ignavibacteriota bacterium]